MSRQDLDSIAQMFHLAGVCREPNTHVYSLTPHVWARRCITLGLNPRTVIRRLQSAQAQEELVELPPTRQRRDDHPAVLAGQVVRDLERLRKLSA